ncbi:MAG: glycosyl hydrolase family 8, partial [Chloroflexota bacterium]
MLRLLLAVLCLMLGVIGATLPRVAHPAPLRPQASAPNPASLRAPAVLAKSAYLMDAGTGAVLFEKFPTTRRPMASTAKLMTGLLAAESERLNELATVSRLAASVGETSMGLVEGEQVPVSELLYGLLLNSANDAAIVLAEHLAGSVAAFVEQMNARASALGLTDTHYVNAHGLDHGRHYSLEHYSSARDLAVLGATGMANPVFARAAGTTRRDVPGRPDEPPHHLRHTVSALWWYPGVLGGKSGWTGRAGQVRVVVAERAGTRLVAVVMRSPDHIRELRDLLDYGFAISSSGEARAQVPLTAEGFPLPEPRLTQAWERYKELALAPDGRVRRGAKGDEATSDAQAAALLHAVWFRDRVAFDRIWSWTKAALSRRRDHPANPHKDALFAGRWAQGEVTDWANSTAADQRLGAALLLASKLWHEPAYAEQAQPVLSAVLYDAAISWQTGGVPSAALSIPAANSFLKELEPVTTSAATLTPAFYRMFGEGTRNAIWLAMLDGAYLSLERAMAADGPLGTGAGVLPSWFSVSGEDGRVGEPIDPSWQTTGFGEASSALAWQLALDLRWSGDPRARALLLPTARLLSRELAQGRHIAAAYSRSGRAVLSTETAAYGALSGIALAELEPNAAAALRSKLEPALKAGNPDRILDAIDGLWLLAGGPPNYWRIFWPPKDLPTTRNDAVVPPSPDAGIPWRYFEQTGHVVQGRFLEYFLAGGGIDTFGYPRTDEFDEDGRLVQYFQRGRMEYFPEREGDGLGVALAPLGLRAAQARDTLSRPEAQPVSPFESDEARTYVPESSHSLMGGFREFYERAGGAPV